MKAEAQLLITMYLPIILLFVKDTGIVRQHLQKRGKNNGKSCFTNQLALRDFQSPLLLLAQQEGSVGLGQ
jgi:hypothetical protein